MQFTSENMDELEPYRSNTFQPPRDVVLTARQLLGKEERVDSLVEVQDNAEGTRFNIFIVTARRLIAVRGTGPQGWDWGSPDEIKRTVQGVSWRLPSIEAMASSDQQTNRFGFERGTLWARHRLAVSVAGQEPFLIPELAKFGDEDEVERFQLSLLDAWRAA